MCVSREAMNKAMAEKQEWKRIKEEAEANISALDRIIIDFLQETAECEATDKKGNPVFKFIGEVHKATYSWTERETVDKAEVKKMLNEDDYLKVSRVSRYQVLKVN